MVDQMAEVLRQHSWQPGQSEFSFGRELKIAVNSFVRVDETFSNMSEFRAKQREITTKSNPTAAEIMDSGMAGMRAGSSMMSSGIIVPGHSEPVLKNLGIDLEGSAVKVIKSAIIEFKKALMQATDKAEISEITGHRNRASATIAQHYVAAHNMDKAFEELMPLFDDETGERLLLAAIDRYDETNESDESPEAQAKASRDVALLMLAAMGHEYYRGSGAYNTVIHQDVTALLEHSEKLHPAAQDNARLRAVLERIGK